jgi:MFS family permease
MNSYEKARKRNIQILTFSNSLMALAFGLFGPFYLIFINQIGGGIENFGIAVGLIVLADSLTSFFVGRYSDKFGRKPFLLLGALASALVVFFYTIIGTVWQLYIIQIFSGIIIAIYETSEHALLADLTKRYERGKEIGKYYLYTGIAEAIALVIGGFLVVKYGFKPIFYIVSIIFVISTIFLFKIKEKVKS